MNLYEIFCINSFYCYRFTVPVAELIIRIFLLRKKNLISINKYKRCVDICCMHKHTTQVILLSKPRILVYKYAGLNWFCEIKFLVDAKWNLVCPCHWGTWQTKGGLLFTDSYKFGIYLSFFCYTSTIFLVLYFSTKTFFKKHKKSLCCFISKRIYY